MTQLMRRSEIESVKCVGCEFIRMFSPHDGGYCQTHGDIPATIPLADTIDEVIKVLGGNDLTLKKEPYDWCCPDCQELDCECDKPRERSW